jgi:O-antigen/teichoic acid export membrane protein
VTTVSIRTESAPPELNQRFSLAFRRITAAFASSAYLWSLLMFGASGLAVTVANIIWARFLPVQTYAVVALWLAIFNSAIRLAPFGADLEVVRSNGLVTSASIRQVVVTAVLTGVMASIITSIGYKLALPISASVAAAIGAGGILTYASAAMQARRKYAPSLLLLHTSNYVTLLVALVTVGLEVTNEATIVCALAVCMVAVLALTAATLARMRTDAFGESSWTLLQRLWPLLVITGSYELMMMSDRLTTPLLLSFEDLAVLSVLLALAGPPFRLLELAVSYTLMPELKSAADGKAVAKVILHSSWLAGVLSACASLCLLLVLGPLSSLLFGDKFEIPLSLVLAVLCVGIVRVAHSFAHAAATALVPESELPRLAVLGTIAAVLVVVGAIAGALWGLQGIVYGSLTGWLFRTAVYAGLVHQAIRNRAADSMVTLAPDIAGPVVASAPSPG